MCIFNTFAIASNYRGNSNKVLAGFDHLDDLDQDEQGDFTPRSRKHKRSHE
jgi:hypothetical protein